MSALVPLALSGQMSGQIAISKISASDTQAIIQYLSPVAAACSFQVADMNRAISVVAVSQGTGQVTMTTVAPHGLLAGAVIYLENSGPWNGWQTVTSVPTTSSFVFPTNATGGTSGGNVGVLVDDVNPALFPGANLDTRRGSISAGQPTAPGQLIPLVVPPAQSTSGRNRTIVIGKRAADVASDGFRYSRALQANSRHHLSLTCGTQTFEQDFPTANVPLGDTYNEGPPVDRNAPGHYSYPNVQWSNMAQSLIDPLTGLRSQRATGPAGAPSQPQTFQTAIDVQGAWQNAIAPLTNTVTAATYNGSCASGTCPLFLRADNLSMNGGASYTQGGATTAGASFDWITVTVKQASISGACSGDDCKLEACLTVDGVTCASSSQEATLSTTPANVTFGSGKMMDLWQGSGPPTISRVDATEAMGTVNYKASTNQLNVVKGAPFNIRWGPGSQITVAGGAFTIASVQSEQVLTLANGPTNDVTNAPYSANNFGVLLFKKTNSANAVSLGYATFTYAATIMPPYSPQASNYCSNIVTVNGVPGYDCFIDNELYWAAADGSDSRDMGMVQLQGHSDGRWPNQYPCGKGQQLSQFDPQNGDIWYCMVPIYGGGQNRLSIVQAHYMGSHARSTPGAPIPDCDLNNNAQPCIKYTIMQPKPQDAISQTGPPFNPAFAASGYTLGGIVQGGISSDGDLMVYSEQGAQDTRGWLFIYTLGDRTPTGTTPNSFRIVASASTFLVAPLSWCTIHSTEPPDGGWTQTVHNSFPIMGQAGKYDVTFTSGNLNNTPGDPNGLNPCPANNLGVTGNACTTVTIAGQPTSELDGSQPQKLQVGDLMRIYDAYEFVRVVAIVSDTQITLQRGYPGPPTLDAAENHTTNVAVMNCGTYNNQSATLALWNYRADPMGLNADGTTIKNNPTALGGHQYAGAGVAVTAGGFPYNLGNTLCPQAQLTASGSCTQVIPGSLYAPTGPAVGVAVSPAFGGKIGIGSPNTVDSHPGPCFQGWCTDARPLDGGGPGNLGSAPQAPWANVSGQLWKIGGGQKYLNRKYLHTIAYVGRFPLVDVSGPKSVLTDTAKDSYKYCYAAVAGECSAGSAIGDVFVNSPYVSYPFCYYPGVALFDDDANAICIGDLGAYTGNIVQFGTSQQDVIGAVTRRLGTNYAKYNQMDVFWTASPVPSGQMMFSQARWLDGIRTDDLTSTMPPFPAPDGVARNSFEAFQVAITVPQGLPAQSAIVEFGYVENGGSGSYFCTSRQEACVATAGSIDPNTPFYFEQTEQYTAQPCANGCTISVPALPEHVLYYRWRFIGANGQVIQSGTPQVAIIP